MKIVFISGNGLMSTLYNEIAKEHDVTVIALEHIKELSSDINQIVTGNPYESIDKKLKSKGSQLSLPYHIPNLTFLLAKENPDLIFVLDFTKLWFLQVLFYKILTQDVKVRVITESKRVPASPLSKIGFYFFLNIFRIFKFQIEKVFALTKQGQTFLSRIRGLPTISHSLLPVSHTNINNILHSHKDNGPLKVLLPARFADFKGHNIAIEAIKDIANIELSMISFDRNSGNAEKLKKMVHEFGLENKTTFTHGAKYDEAIGIIDTHDVVVMPSFSEPYGIFVPLAVMRGVYTVTSNSVGANDYIVDDTIGKIFEEGDVLELKEILQKLVKDKVSLRKHRKLRTDKYNTKEMSKKFVD